MTANVEVPDCVIVLLNHLEDLMDDGRLEEDAIHVDMWNAVSTYNVTKQPAQVAPDFAEVAGESEELVNMLASLAWSSHPRGMGYVESLMPKVYAAIRNAIVISQQPSAEVRARRRAKWLEELEK